MSKSLNNFYTIKNLVERGFEPLDFKYFCLNTHYSKKLNFTFDGLTASANGYKKLKNLLQEHKNGNIKIEEEKLNEYSQKFLNAINDDLNFPLAIGIVWDIVRTEQKSKDVYNLVLGFDKALGLKLDEVKSKQNVNYPEEVLNLASLRQEARKNKNWAESDKLREEILKFGYKIKDTKEGYELEKL